MSFIAGRVGIRSMTSLIHNSDGVILKKGRTSKSGWSPPDYPGSPSLPVEGENKSLYVIKLWF